MAISNLITPGQATERPSVSAFFGQSYTGGATQKVSSTMMSDSFVDSTVNMLKGLNTEIARIQTTSKKTLVGFDKVINSIRDLNRNITMRFRTLNNELTASRVDFLRGVLNAPEVPPADLGGTPILVMKNDQPTTEPPKKDPEKNPSLLEMLMSTAGEAVLGQVLTKMLTGGGAIAKTLISAIFNPLVLGAAGFVALAYFAGKARAENPEGFVEFMNKMKTGGEKSKVITGPEEETKKFGPVKESGIIKPSEILKRNNLTEQDVVSTKFNAATKSNIMTVKDGRWIDLSSKSDKLQPPETHPDYVEPGYTTPSGNLLKEPQTPAQKSQANRAKAAAGTPLPVATPTAEPRSAAAPAPASPPAASTGTPTRGSLKGALEKSLPVKKSEPSAGASEGEVKAEQKKETGDIIMGTNQFKQRRAKTMDGDKLAEFEGYKTSEQKSLADQMIPDARSPGSNIDRGSADEFEIRARLERGERVDPDKPPPTMTKRELANRIKDYGMPALASGAYTPEEFQKITKQAGQYQWQSNAQEKAGEWIKNQSAEAMARKSFRPLVPPVVMNNSSTTNNSSSSGGEGNNVAGQNFPLSAINPHIQEFLAKQNVQYQ